MLRFKVFGMTCDHCVRAVTEAVKGADPGASVEIDLGSGTLLVRSATVPAPQIAQAIEGEGYAAELAE